MALASFSMTPFSSSESESSAWLTMLTDSDRRKIGAKKLVMCHHIVGFKEEKAQKILYTQTIQENARKMHINTAKRTEIQQNAQNRMNLCAKMRVYFSLISLGEAIPLIWPSLPQSERGLRMKVILCSGSVSSPEVCESSGWCACWLAALRFRPLARRPPASASPSSRASSRLLMGNALAWNSRTCNSTCR